MANSEHLSILEKGVEAWQNWREKNPRIRPDLSKAYLERGHWYKIDLSNVDLSGASLAEASLVEVDFRNANLSGSDLGGADLLRAKLQAANLNKASLCSHFRHTIRSFTENPSQESSWDDTKPARLREANLGKANLGWADLCQVDLTDAKLSGADLFKANLRGANLTRADLSNANLVDADLSEAILYSTNLTRATLSNCRIHGISVWKLNLNKTTQSNLIITDKNEPLISVDNLEVAQFIYLLLHSEKIRYVIDTITSKVVLILGRFTPERNAVLDAIRNKLRDRNYIPVLFDFDKPESRDTHETVTTLARLARFVIADITNPRSVPQELVSIVESLPSLPIQPLLEKGREPWGMFDHIKRYPWVLEIHLYDNLEHLLTSLEEKVIAPAEGKLKELLREKQGRPMD